MLLEQHMLLPQGLDIKRKAGLNVDWLSAFVDSDELLLDLVVVWLVGVLERPDVVEDIFDFLDVLRLVDPKILLRILKTSRFDLLYSLHRVFPVLTPLQLLLEEVQDDEVQTPEVVPPRQVYVVVGV